MSRYIDADKLKYSLELSIKSWGRDCNSNAPVIKTAYQDVLYRLEAMQTADVVEVRHGEWDYIATHDCFSCNLCKFDSDVAMKYCGGCGAKMDGERREE